MELLDVLCNGNSSLACKLTVTLHERSSINNSCLSEHNCYFEHLRRPTEELPADLHSHFLIVRTTGFVLPRVLLRHADIIHIVKNAEVRSAA
eukprot:515619-Pelagomonas_calceolata.AAC.6